MEDLSLEGIGESIQNLVTEGATALQGIYSQNEETAPPSPPSPASLVEEQSIPYTPPQVEQPREHIQRNETRQSTPLRSDLPPSSITAEDLARYKALEQGVASNEEWLRTPYSSKAGYEKITEGKKEELSGWTNELFGMELLVTEEATDDTTWVLAFLKKKHKEESNYDHNKNHRGIEGTKGKPAITTSYGVLVADFPKQSSTEGDLQHAYRYAFSKFVPHFKNSTFTDDGKIARLSYAWNTGDLAIATTPATSIPKKVLTTYHAVDDKSTAKGKKGRTKGVSVGLINQRISEFNALSPSFKALNEVVSYSITKEGKGHKVTYTYADGKTFSNSSSFPIHSDNNKKVVGLVIKKEEGFNWREANKSRIQELRHLITDKKKMLSTKETPNKVSIRKEVKTLEKELGNRT